MKTFKYFAVSVASFFIGYSYAIYKFVSHDYTDEDFPTLKKSLEDRDVDNLDKEKLKEDLKKTKAKIEQLSDEIKKAK